MHTYYIRNNSSSALHVQLVVTWLHVSSSPDNFTLTQDSDSVLCTAPVKYSNIILSTGNALHRKWVVCIRLYTTQLHGCWGFRHFLSSYLLRKLEWQSLHTRSPHSICRGSFSRYCVQNACTLQLESVSASFAILSTQSSTILAVVVWRLVQVHDCTVYDCDSMLLYSQLWCQLRKSAREFMGGMTACRWISKNAAHDECKSRHVLLVLV